MRYIKITIAIILASLILVSVFFQVKVERYRISSSEKYGILVKETRQSYMPISWFFIQVKLFHNKDYDIYFETARVPFEQVGIKEHYLFNAFYSAYLMYSYYDRDTLIKLKNAPV